MTIRLRARFANEAAAHLRESRLAEDQVIMSDKDGWVLVEATVADTPQLRWWLLGFGAQVEVLEPVILRKEIVAKVSGLTKLYKTAIEEDIALRSDK